MSPILFYTLAGSLGVLLLGGGVVFLKNKLNPREEELVPQDWELLMVEVPKFNDKGPDSAEIMFAALHGLLKETPGVQEHFSFEILATKLGIRFFVAVPKIFSSFVKSQVYAQYPTAEIRQVEKDYASIELGERVVSASGLGLVREEFFPIKTFPNFEVDPLASITSATEALSEGGEIWFQVLLRPVADTWQKAGYTFVKNLKAGKKPPEPLLKALRKDLGLMIKDIFLNLVSIIPEIIMSFLNPETSLLSKSEADDKKKKEKKDELSAEDKLKIEGIEKKLTKLGFETYIRLVAIGEDIHSSSQQLDSFVAALKQFSTVSLNSLSKKGSSKTPEQILDDYRERYFPSSSNDFFVLNTEELASLYHLPNSSVATPNIVWTKAKKSEYPLNLPVGVEPIIGQTSFREDKLEFGVHRDDRRRHMYIIGKTGTGKSTLLENLIYSDIENGEGLAVIDPHGDTIERILQHIPPHRMDDTILFDPSDLEHPVSINMLESFDSDQRALMASGLADVFLGRYAFSTGPRMEHILRNCLLTLLDVPHTTLLGITRLLTDRSYRKYIVHLLQDPILKSFWDEEFEALIQSRQGAEAVAPIQNRIGPFLSAPMIRNIVGQPVSTVKIDEVMNTGKIFLANLSQGKIGGDNASILGGMLVSRMRFAAMTRVRIPEEERRDFYLYVDEFQNLATPDFASILSEARKYRLCLILANQYLSQVPEEVRDAIFGNVGTMMSFTIGESDASIIEKEFSPIFDSTDLVSLERFNIYIKMMIKSGQAKPFSAVTLPPRFNEHGLRDQVIARSREKYSVNREKVENRIARWTKKEFIPGMDDEAVSQLRSRLKSEQNKACESPKIPEVQSQ